MVEVELPADVGVGEAYGAVLGVGGGGESLGEHVAVDVQVVRDERRARCVGEFRPVQVELTADLCVGQAYGAVFTVAGGGETVQKDPPVDAQVIGDKGGSRRIDQRCTVQVELATDVASRQAHRTTFAVPGGREALSEHQPPAGMQAVADERGTRLVGQLGAVEVELTDDVRSGQPDRAELPVTGGHETPTEQVAIDMDPIGDEGGPGLIGQPRTVDVELACDVHAEQAYRGMLPAPGDGEPLAEQQVSVHDEPIGIQGG